MNPYTKLFEIDKNANEFGTLFKSQVKLKPLRFFLTLMFQPVLVGFLETAPDPHQVSGVVLRVDDHGCHKNKYPFLIYNHGFQIY
jgi:hypothetical protein